MKLIHEEEIRALQHAVQTGIAYEIEQGGSAATPKHLRVGVDTALVDAGALVMLLIEKGVFTMEEYQTKRLEYWKREVEAYEARLSASLGVPTRLA